MTYKTVDRMFYNISKITVSLIRVQTRLLLEHMWITSLVDETNYVSSFCQVAITITKKNKKITITYIKLTIHFRQ